MKLRACVWQRSLAVAGLILCLSACGGDTENPAADPATEPAPAPAVTPSPAPPAPTPAPPPAPAPTANLLFRSGFEGGAMSILPPVDCWGTGCWQELVGLDSLTSFNWPGDIGGGGGKFLLLTSPVSVTPA